MKFWINEEDLANLGTPKQRAQATEALKSGKYEKHKGAMTNLSSTDKACCLMVMAQEIDDMPWESALAYGAVGSPRACIGSDDSWFSVQADNIKVNHDIGECDLASLNDGFYFGDNYHELTHPQIGDLIAGEVVEI